MKKVFSILMLLLVLCTCIFASHRVSVTIDPFAWQGFLMKNNGSKSTEHSTYGLGGGLGYDWAFYKNFRAGVDVKCDTYFLKDKNNFTDISFLGKAGYVYKLNETLNLYGNMKFGLDLQVHDKKTSAVMEFGPEIGLEYKFNEKVDFFVSCEGLFGFPKKGDTKYAEFRITPTIGAGYVL